MCRFCQSLSINTEFIILHPEVFDNMRTYGAAYTNFPHGFSGGPSLLSGHPPTKNTLRMPTPSASKCLYPQSLFGTGNTNALRLDVYFPCLLLCIEALTRTRFGINRVFSVGGCPGNRPSRRKIHVGSFDFYCLVSCKDIWYTLIQVSNDTIYFDTHII